jgi:hypothetical protein
MKPEEFLTVQQLASRLGYEVKTVQNKIAAGIFKKGVHYSTAPGLPILFRWSAILALYSWSCEPSSSTESQRPGRMAQKYSIGD